MNEQVSKADQVASAFEAFIAQHEVSTTIILAILCSWTVTLAVKSLLTPWQSRWKSTLLRLFDIAAAGILAGLMWPSSHPAIWGLFIGSSSPIVYLAVSELACWKWPGLRRFLSLRELAVPDPSEDTEQLIPPEDKQ